MFLFGPTVQGIAYGIVTCVLIEVAVLDFKTMEISDLASILIALVGIVLMICNGTYISSLIGFICVSLPFLVLTLLKTMGISKI